MNDTAKHKAKSLTQAQILGDDPVPEEQIRAVPRIFTNSHSVDIARDVRSAIREADCVIFRDTRGVFTIEDDGERLQRYLVTKDDLGIRLEELGICLFIKGNEEKYAPSKLTGHDAVGIMATKLFRDVVPEVSRMSEIRLPRVIRRGASLAFAPLPRGYDSDSKVFSADRLAINWDSPYTLEKSKKVLTSVFKDFPFDGGIPLERSRSFGGVIMALLGRFLQHNFKVFPLVQVNGNQSGLGKSFLVEAINAPFQQIAAQNFPDDEKEIQKKLFSLALEGEAVVFIDEASKAFSKALLTYTGGAGIVKDRVLGKNQMVEVGTAMQIFLNGRGIKSSIDFERRTLNIDLFHEDDARLRSFERPPDFIHLPDTRKQVLQALWGLCKAWEKAGAPLVGEVGIYSTYKEYIRLTNSILLFAGYTSPLEERVLNMDTGDTAGGALQEILVMLADQIQPPADDAGRQNAGMQRKYTVAEIMEAARVNDKLEIIVGASRQPEATLGTKLREMKGRRFVDSYGRRFLVGDKMRSASTCYPFTILSEPVRGLDTEYPRAPL